MWIKYGKSNKLMCSMNKVGGCCMYLLKIKDI